MILQAGIDGENNVSSRFYFLSHNRTRRYSNSIDSLFKPLLAIDPGQAGIELTLKTGKSHAIGANKANQVSSHRTIWIKPGLMGIREDPWDTQINNLSMGIRIDSLFEVYVVRSSNQFGQ